MRPLLPLHRLGALGRFVTVAWLLVACLPAVIPAQVRTWSCPIPYVEPCPADVAPEPRTRPLPIYPDILRQAGVDGTVTARFVVDTLGRVRLNTLRVLSASHDLFSSAVRRAIPGWQYTPARIAGVPVEHTLEQSFSFHALPRVQGSGRLRDAMLEAATAWRLAKQLSRGDAMQVIGGMGLAVTDVEPDEAAARALPPAELLRAQRAALLTVMTSDSIPERAARCVGVIAADTLIPADSAHSRCSPLAAYRPSPAHRAHQRTTA